MMRVLILLFYHGLHQIICSTLTIRTDSTTGLNQISLSSSGTTTSKPEIERPRSPVWRPMENGRKNKTNHPNLIFASFASLLQQWPNSFAYSGHSIIPGLIPRSTILYHGTHHAHPPPTRGLEWLGFDPEMSYSVHGYWGGRTALYRYRSTRALRIIYFDGQSASLGIPGFSDSQSVIINATVDLELGDRDHDLEVEYLRAQQLCRIGRDWGFEGIVRMNTGFELIWCNFENGGLKLLDGINTTDPLNDDSSKRAILEERHHRRARSPLYSKAIWMEARLASQYFFSPGEVRIKLDPSGFISFYDRIPSLDLKRSIEAHRNCNTDSHPDTLINDGSRFGHRLYGISPKDSQLIRDRLYRVLARKNSQDWKSNDSDRVDWRDVVLSITRTYAPRLDELMFILRRDGVSTTSTNEKVIEVRDSTYGMLMPYLDFTNWNVTTDRTSDDHQVIQRCIKAFTSSMDEEEEEDESSSITDSIRLLIEAIEGTLERLCRTIHRIFSQSMLISSSSIATNIEGPTKLSINSSDHEPMITRQIISRWTQEMDELINWLAWSTQGYCNPICKANEICMPPMWPSIIRTNISSYELGCMNRTGWEELHYYL